MIIITSKEGTITCKSSKSEQFNFVQEICEDILEKVDELISKLPEKIDFDTDKIDFEVISYPKDNIESKVNDYLDTIVENDTSDTGASLDNADSLHIIRDEEFADSDGLVNEKHLQIGCLSPCKEVDSSNASDSR